MDLRLRGKTVVITGGGGDIGRECARSFAAEGANLVLSDMNAAAATSVAEEAQRLGVAAIAIQTDVVALHDVERLFDTTLATFGTVDVLVNNAGIFQSRAIADLSEEDWDRVMDVNLKGVFLCSQVAFRHMRERRSGSIVSLASLAGQVGGIHAGANYAASKAGVASFTKSLAKAAGPFGVRVNCVNPGVIATQMTSPWPSEVLAAMVERTPLSRLGRADEVASVIAFLASDAASWIHGAHIDINGGINMD